LITRLADPNPPPVDRFSARLVSCVALFSASGYQATIAWQHADDNDTISAAAISVAFGANVAGSSSGASGQLVLNTSDYMGMGNITVSTSSGDTVTLASCP
jgi:hypothetical protein